MPPGRLGQIRSKEGPRNKLRKGWKISLWREEAENDETREPGVPAALPELHWEDLKKSGKADGRAGSGTRGRGGGRPAAAASKGAAAEQGGHGDENQQSKAGTDG